MSFRGSRAQNTRRLAFSLPAMILAGIILFAWSRKHEDSGSSTKIPVSPKKSDIDTFAVAPEKPPLSGTHIEINDPNSGTTMSSNGTSMRRAYQFIMDRGVVRLEAVEDLRGDFRSSRGDAAPIPGMWCCRLVDENDRALAQEIFAAPNQSCLVLDPNMPDSEGKPTAAAFRPKGPTVFQVRMPVHNEAKVMKIYRLTGGGVAGLEAEPFGSLIASIQLPE